MEACNFLTRYVECSPPKKGTKMKLLYWVVFVVVIYYNDVYHLTKNPYVIGLMIWMGDMTVVGVRWFLLLLFKSTSTTS